MINVVTTLDDTVITDNISFYNKNCIDKVLDNLDLEYIIQSFGEILYDSSERYIDISASTKTLINIICYPDKVFDISYCSWYVIKAILELENANVYIDYPYFMMTVLNKEFKVDGVVVPNSRALIHYLVERFK